MIFAAQFWTLINETNDLNSSQLIIIWNCYQLNSKYRKNNTTHNFHPSFPPGNWIEKAGGVSPAIKTIPSIPSSTRFFHQAEEGTVKRAQLFVERFFQDGLIFNGHVKPQSAPWRFRVSPRVFFRRSFSQAMGVAQELVYSDAKSSES